MTKLFINFLIMIVIAIMLALLWIWGAILVVLPVGLILFVPCIIIEHRELLMPYIILFIFSIFTWHVDIKAFKEEEGNKYLLPWTKYPWKLSRKLINILRSINDYSKRIKRQR